MDALVPAFVAALLAQFGDRSSWLVATLADRYRRPFTITVAAAIAHGLCCAIAATGGALVAPMLTPNARRLMLALALFFAAAGALWPLKAPDRLEGWKLGPLLTPFLGVLILSFGDTAAFFTLAIAVQGSPWLAAIGATTGAGAVALAAALAGEASWRRLPIGRFRAGFGLLCLVGGAWLAAQALRLI